MRKDANKLTGAGTLNRKEFLLGLCALGVGVAAYSPAFKFGQKMNWLPKNAFLYSYGSYGSGHY